MDTELIRRTWAKYFWYGNVLLENQISFKVQRRCESLLWFFYFYGLGITISIRHCHRNNIQPNFLSHYKPQHGAENIGIAPKFLISSKLVYLQHISTFETPKNLWYSFYICNHGGQNNSDHLYLIELFIFDQSPSLESVAYLWYQIIISVILINFRYSQYIQTWRNAGISAR